jgi:hypothetical protein
MKDIHKRRTIKKVLIEIISGLALSTSFYGSAKTPIKHSKLALEKNTHNTNIQYKYYKADSSFLIEWGPKTEPPLRVKLVDLWKAIGEVDFSEGDSRVDDILLCEAPHNPLRWPPTTWPKRLESSSVGLSSGDRLYVTYHETKGIGFESPAYLGVGELITLTGSTDTPQWIPPPQYWQPVCPPNITEINYTKGIVTLGIRGREGLLCILEETLDLKDWKTIGNYFTLPTENVNINTDIATKSQSFYRVKAPLKLME